VDEYAWVRSRHDPEAVAYLEAENQYTDAVMQPMAEIEEKLYREILGRVTAQAEARESHLETRHHTAIMA